MHGFSKAPVMSDRLRVLSVSHSAVNRTSGRFRYERLAALCDDIDLTLVAPSNWREYGRPLPPEPHAGPLDFRVQPIRLPHVPRVGWYLHHYPRLGRLIREVKPDVLHLWEEPWSAVGLQALWLRDRLCPKAALILETDQNILRRLPPPFEHIRRYTQKHVDLMIVRSPESETVARSTGYTGPTATVEYGVFPGVFERQDRGAARAAIGVSGFVIGYVGRVIPEKGLHDVLEAMAGCPAPITFVVVGAGADLEPLSAHARQLGIADRLRLLPPRTPAGVAEVMNALDVLLLMSRTTRTWKEQFGRVIIEAHACGVPVIGSDSGAIPGVVAGGGWIVPEGDAPALATLLTRLVAAPDEIARAGAAGYSEVQARFSIDTIGLALGDAYRQAAMARRATRH